MAWNRTKPGAGDSLESSPVRANFQAVDGALWGKNLLANSEANIWPEGSDTGANAPPAHYSLIGTPDISCITGGKRTKFSVKCTYSGSGTDGVRQSLLPVHDGSFDGVSVSVAVWMDATSLGVTVGIEDGGTGGSTDSALHSGGGDWELLTLTHVITADSTKLDFIAEITATGNFAMNQPTVVFGSIPSSDTIPAEIVEDSIQWSDTGALATGGVPGARFVSLRPFFVIEGGVTLDSAPVTQAVLIQLLKQTSTEFSRLYATGTGSAIQVQPGAFGGTRVPNHSSTFDSTGAADVSMFSRSFLGLGGSSGTLTSGGSSGLKYKRLRGRVDQTDTGAADAVIFARIFQYKRPLASYLRPQDEN